VNIAIVVILTLALLVTIVCDNYIIKSLRRELKETEEQLAGANEILKTAAAAMQSGNDVLPYHKFMWRCSHCGRRIMVASDDYGDALSMIVEQSKAHECVAEVA
jgi:hypothetical protein